MNFILKIILGTALSVFSSGLHAQDRDSKKTCLSINGIYGISGLYGTINDGEIKPSQGIQVSLEGSYFFFPFVAIGIGAGYADYASTLKADNYSSSLSTVDEEGDNLEYRIKASNLSEQEKISAFEVPLFLTFRPIRSTKFHFETNLGVKASIPLSSSYAYSSGVITTTGYYQKYNVELTDMPNHGFQTTDATGLTGKLPTKTTFSAFARFGFVIPMGKLSLHLGVYGSYGLSPALQQGSKSLVTYPGVYQSASSLSEKVNLLTAGVRIGISI
jgi:OmpA-OmpF porin, OOP family